MDQKVEIKEEPVWLEGTASTSLNNNEPVSEMIHLKEETKSELVEPGQMQVNTSEPFADVKDEIFVEEHIVGQLDPCFKEDNIMENIGIWTRDPVDSCGSCCKVQETGSEQFCSFLTDNGERPLHCKECSGMHSLQYNSDRKMLSSSFKSHVGDLISSHSSEEAYCSDESTKMYAQKFVPRKAKSIKHPNLCNVCGNTFSQKSVLKRHMLSHTGERPYGCEICYKYFGEKSTLKAHMFTHSGERPHICSVCDSKFSRKSNLICHMLTHSGNRIHVCDTCGSKFSHKSALNRHILAHSRERPYCCHECGKTFSRKSYLKYHMPIHSGEMAYQCTDCGKGFTQKASLDRHTLIHSGRRPHACNVCSNLFAHKSSLKSHMQTHSGHRPHVCSECCKTYSRKSYLKVHILTHSRKTGTCL